MLRTDPSDVPVRASFHLMVLVCGIMGACLEFKSLWIQFEHHSARFHDTSSRPTFPTAPSVLFARGTPPSLPLSSLFRGTQLNKDDCAWCTRYERSGAGVALARLPPPRLCACRNGRSPSATATAAMEAPLA